MTLQPNLYPILTRRAPSTQTHQPLHVDTQLLAHLSLPAAAHCAPSDPTKPGLPTRLVELSTSVLAGVGWT